MTLTRNFPSALNLVLVLLFAAPILPACASSSSSETKSGQTDAAEGKSDKKSAENTFDASAYTGPNFELTLTDTKELVRLTDYFGKGAPVVVNFWGTWCGPCRREMPEFKKIYSEYKEHGVEIIGLALRENAPRVNSYVKQQGIEWPQVIGGVKEATVFGRITGVPTTIFFDSQGNELRRYVGPISYTMFKNTLDRALEREKELAQL